MNGTPAELLQLRDIHVPGEPPLWPPAPGWWLLALAGLLLLAVMLRWLWRRWRKARFRRRVMAEFAQLSAEAQAARLVAGLSVLLKRVALARYPRAEVASLCGADWLAFLDRHGGGGGFAQGAGTVLADGPYAASLEEVDRDALIKLGKSWVRKNL